jgi:hypothetical protein
MTGKASAVDVDRRCAVESRFGRESQHYSEKASGADSK